MDTARSILVLAAGWGLLLLVSYDLRLHGAPGWRRCILDACVIMGVLVWLISEILSSFRGITPAGLLISWLVVGSIAIIIAARSRRTTTATAITGEFRGLARAVRSLPGTSKATLVFIGVGVAILGVIAFVAAPNTWDSMTYHLSRVMHWRQDQSVEFFATSVQRQLSFGPLAEMSILQFQVLGGSDRLANFPQWFAMIGCVLGTSLIAKRLGASSSGQIFTALATSSLPMGVLQATSSQNDYVMALWCVCFVESVLDGWRKASDSRLVTVTGAALGLAVLTKVPAVLYLAPMGVWWTVILIRRFSGQAWKPLLGVILVAAAILAPHSIRNYRLFRTPLGPTSGLELGGLTNEVHSLPSLASNITRNLSLQMALPDEGFNSGLETVLQKAHAVLGMDTSDPRTTWRGLQFHLVFSAYEDSAGNPLHLLLLIVAAFMVIRSRNSTTLVYLGCLVMGFLLFCWLLKWQPWNSRLALALLVLGMPLAGAAWTGQFPRRATVAASVLLAVASIPYLVANPTRPVFGVNSVFIKDRLHQYFANVPDSLYSYEAAAKMIHDARCTRVALASPPEGREYLLWVTNAAYGDEIRIEHVLVKNVSRRLATDVVPCAIVFTYPIAERNITYQNSAYAKVIDSERFSLYLPAGPSP